MVHDGFFDKHEVLWLSSAAGLLDGLASLSAIPWASFADGVFSCFGEAAGFISPGVR